MKSVLIAGLAALALSIPARADVEKTEEYDFEVVPGARISLENVNGNITISGGTGNRVHVVAHKKADTEEYLEGLEIRIEATPESIRIETRHPKSDRSWFNWGENGGGRVAFELKVPASVDLDAVTTVNGDIHITGVSGSVEVETVNGSLKAAELAGNARLETVNGSVEARFARVGQDQRIAAETVNGRIEFYLPAETSCRVSAETLNGKIDAGDFGLEAQKGFIGRDLSGEIGTGAARISLDTVNGSIRLHKS